MVWQAKTKCYFMISRLTKYLIYIIFISLVEMGRKNRVCTKQSTSQSIVLWACDYLYLCLYYALDNSIHIYNTPSVLVYRSCTCC
jgi:hypothetical protein